jgi:uncharacterized membrane protein YgdD (TMEM256/DUF423 family)
MQKRFLIFGGFSGAVAVALGAMGAHFLKSKLATGLITENNLNAFDTATKYHLIHSIVVLFVSLAIEKLDSKLITKAGYCFMAGIILFSGSIYILSTSNLMGLSAVNWLGPITPIGGIFLITGWLMLAFSGLKK